MSKKELFHDLFKAFVPLAIETEFIMRDATEEERDNLNKHYKNVSKPVKVYEYNFFTEQKKGEDVHYG